VGNTEESSRAPGGPDLSVRKAGHRPHRIVFLALEKPAADGRVASTRRGELMCGLLFIADLPRLAAFTPTFSPVFSPRNLEQWRATVTAIAR
jgi:hypothetical protein